MIGVGMPRAGPVVILGGAAVQAEALVAAHALGHEAHVVAARCGAAAADAADAVVTLDLRDVDAVTAYASEVGAAAVYSVGSDLAMPVVAEVSERLGLASLVSRHTADLCHHKHLMRAVLRELPGAIPHASVSRGDPLPLPLPVIVKPDDSQGQRGLALVTAEEAFAPALEQALRHSSTGRAIVEAYVAGPEVSVNGYLRGGRLVFAGVSDRLTWPDELGLVRGHAYPPQAATGPDLDEAVTVLDHACRAIGLADGPVYAQMIVSPQGVRMVEISPRLDGCHLWRLWRAASGVDLLAAAVAAACGESDSTALAVHERPLVPIRPSEGEPSTAIEFDCLPPGATVPPRAPAQDAPGVLRRVHYYQPGAVVGPVNGRMEKVGWTLRRGGLSAERAVVAAHESGRSTA